MSYSLLEEILTDNKHLIYTIRQDFICNSFRCEVFLIFISEDEHSCGHSNHTKLFYRNRNHINHKLKRNDQDEDDDQHEDQKACQKSYLQDMKSPF